MLSAVPSSLPPLLSIAVDQDDPRAVCASRKKKPPVAGTTASATPAPTAGAKGSKGTQATKGTRATKGTKTAAPPTSPSGYARTTAAPRSSSSAAAKKSGPLAFLDDPKLSMEQKLLKLLGYLNDKWNKELDQKMKEFKQTSTKTSTSTSGGGSSGGGLLGKAVSFATSAVPQLGVALSALRDPAVRGVVKNVAGPALAAAATAAGQPQLAPLALKFGPDLVDAAASAAASASPGSGTAAPKTRTTTSTQESADGLGSDRDAQLKLMEMQRILDQQKEMFSLVSNLLRTTHDTRMAVIQNVR